MPEEARLPLELLIIIVHTVLADSFHTIFSIGNEVELEWQLNVIATLSLTNSTFHDIVADSVKELMDLKPTPAPAFQCVYLLFLPKALTDRAFHSRIASISLTTHPTR